MGILGGHVAAKSASKTNWRQRLYDSKDDLAANPRAQSGFSQQGFAAKVGGQNDASSLCGTLYYQRYCV
jgi:hypothetical protein